MKNLGPRLRGYARWLPPDWRIFVMVDRDNDNCLALKRELEDASMAAGLRTRSQAGGNGWQVVNRIVVEELEAWYFGDWQAVRGAFPRVSEHVPRQSRYREPDAISGTWEAFERILQRRGYFANWPAQGRSRKGNRRPYRPEPQPFWQLQYVPRRGCGSRGMRAPPTGTRTGRPPGYLNQFSAQGRRAR